MGTRCTIGEHGSCAGCENFIQPTQRDHAHVFRGGGKQNDVICSNCWLIIAIASQSILTALRDVGIIAATPKALRDLIDNFVIIGIQGSLDLTPPSAN